MIEEDKSTVSNSVTDLEPTQQIANFVKAVLALKGGSLVPGTTRRLSEKTDVFSMLFVFQLSEGFRFPVLLNFAREETEKWLLNYANLPTSSFIAGQYYVAELEVLLELVIILNYPVVATQTYASLRFSEILSAFSDIEAISPKLKQVVEQDTTLLAACKLHRYSKYTASHYLFQRGSPLINQFFEKEAVVLRAGKTKEEPPGNKDFFFHQNLHWLLPLALISGAALGFFLIWFAMYMKI